MIALERATDDPDDPSLRIYRDSAIGGIITVSIAGDISVDGFANLDGYQFRKGGSSRPGKRNSFADTVRVMRPEFA